MRLREQEGLSYGAGAWTYAGALDDAGGVGAYAIVAPQNLAKARAALLEELTRLTTTRVTADELARAKQAWIKAQDTSLSQDGYVTDLLADQTFRGRTSAQATQLRARLMAVTVDDLARVAATYLSPGRLVIVDAGDAAKAK